MIVHVNSFILATLTGIPVVTRSYLISFAISNLSLSNVCVSTKWHKIAICMGMEHGWYGIEHGGGDMVWNVMVWNMDGMGMRQRDIWV